jgi:hypothetical protein
MASDAALKTPVFRVSTIPWRLYLGSMTLQARINLSKDPICFTYDYHMRS